MRNDSTTKKNGFSHVKHFSNIPKFFSKLDNKKFEYIINTSKNLTIHFKINHNYEFSFLTILSF